MLVHKVGLFTLVLGAGLISAQSLPASLSASCSDTLKDLLVSPDAACMNLSPFLSLAVGAEKSISVAVNSWLTGLCSSGSCSNENLAAIVANVTSGCAEDISNLGFDASSLQGQITSAVQQAYPTARKILCLKDDDASNLCATQSIESLENAIGPLETQDLSIDTLVGNAQNLISSKNISNLACTRCTQAAVNIVNQDFPDIVSQIAQPIQDVCGASFIGSESPDGITETAAAGQFSVMLESNASTRNIFNFAALMFFILACTLAHVSIV